MERISNRMVIGRVGAIRCALPIEHVVETMRPLPVAPIADAPAFVRGLAIIRGQPTVVVDARALLGIAVDDREAITRFIVVRAGDRVYALAVDEVIGIRGPAAAELAPLPALARSATSAAVAAIGAADAGLLVVLEAARVIPPEAWARIDAERAG